MKRLLLLICCLCSVVAGYAQYTGTLDSSFGANGIVNTQISNSDIFGDIDNQPDGKIVIAGSAGTDFYHRNFIVARYTPDGTPDNSFGTSGIATLFFDTSSAAYNLIIQPDGKIVVAGGSYQKRFLVRFKSNGTIDSSFGVNGMVTDPFGNASLGLKMALQQDGKIVIGAAIPDNNGNYNIAVSRRNVDGSLDTNFGSSGITQTNINVDYNYIADIVLDNDNRIVISATAFNTGTNSDFCLSRYNTDGSADISFGTGGIVTTSLSANGDFPESIALQSDGKIIVGGWAESDVNAPVAPVYFAAARYNTDGSLDNTFGINGIIKDLPNAELKHICSKLLLQSDGKFILVGSSFHETTHVNDFSLARYNADGSRDHSFGINGNTLTSISVNTDSRIYGGALQPDGKIVVAGMPGITIARYHSSGLSLEVADVSRFRENISLYPNPTISTVIVSYMLYEAEETEIVLRDMTGRVICELMKNCRQEAGVHKMQVELPTLINTGLYYVELRSGKEAASIKLLKY